MNANRRQILFLCTGNSCRSQMAEGWARHLHPDLATYHSAGIERHGLNPRAVAAMAEAGVDISGHRSETLDEVPVKEFDDVITVCGHAHEHSPVFPGEARVRHVGFDDPPRLSADLDDEAAIAEIYRRVRDEIRAWIADLPRHLAD